MLGRVVVEREEHVDALGDLRDRLGPLGAVVGLERLTAFIAWSLSSAL